MELKVNELLKYPFLKRSNAMQQKIVAGGRNLILNKLTMWKNKAGKDVSFRVNMTRNEDVHIRNSVLFEQVQWLVRCDKRRKLFCWTCLLFAPSTAMLKSRVNSDLPTLLNIAKTHEFSEGHMDSTLQMQIFIMENFQNPAVLSDRIQLNLIVKRNREILKRLIDAVCCTVAQKHSRGDGKYCDTRVKVKDCTNFLQLLSEFDRGNSDLVEGAADLLKRHPRIVNDLVDAITRVVKMAIKNETQQSTYVSVILSEHGTPQKRKSQISTVLRYIKRGKVCERFTGFINFLVTNTEKGINHLIVSTIEQYGITERFLAVSLSGKVLEEHLLPNLIASVKIDYKYSYFVPWHSHGFGNSLLQSLSEYDECGLFLKKIQSMENFFENSKRRESLEIAVTSKNPELRTNKWYETSPFIIFLATYRNCFVDFFDGVIKNCKYWETDDVTNAIAFRGFLQEILTVFFLNLFNKIFSNDFDETFNFLPESEKEILVFDNPKISAFKKHVGNLKFQSVWDDVASEILKEGQNSKLATEMKESSVAKCNVLFQTLLRHMYKEIDIRCSFLSKLKFCDLLNCNGSGTYVCSPHLLMALMVEHGPFFSEEDLLSEMDALNSNAIFQDKSVHDLLECFAELNLRNVFPQLYKLAEFILTLPYLPASRDKGTSKFKDINNCSYIPETTGMPSGEASFLCVETEMLRDLKDSPQFYDDILAMFDEGNRLLPLRQV